MEDFPQMWKEKIIIWENAKIKHFNCSFLTMFVQEREKMAVYG